MFAVLLSDAKTFPYRERFASLKVFSSILLSCNLFTSSFIISDARSGLFDSPENIIEEYPGPSKYSQSNDVFA